jgi:peptide/nickel transport system ATP-binding protein
MTSKSDPVVSIDDVSIRFERQKLLGLGKSESITAVDDVSLDVYENDVVALVGESGCGKTTLGKTAIGLQRPSGGSVKYRGQDIWEAKDKAGRNRLAGLLNPRAAENGAEARIPYDEIRTSLQIVHQDPGSSLNANYTIMSELSNALRFHEPDLSRQDRRGRILDLLEHVGMTPASDYADRYPHQLSGGEKQRVALTRAMLLNPDLIFADEAISALDVSLRVEMMDFMLDLQERFNTSYLFISHDLSNARYLTDKADGRIGIMYLGQLVEVGTTEQIINDPQHPYTKVLVWATPDLETGEDVDPPVRDIDVPDPANPPSGCRFHTRCPEAREVCRGEEPPTYTVGDGHRAACFRVDEDHEYWESDPIEGTGRTQI